MPRLFNDPYFVVNSRSDFDKLLALSQGSTFAKHKIVIHAIHLTNADLQNLVNQLERNRRATLLLSGLYISDNEELSALPDLSAFKIKELHITRCGFTEAPNVDELTELESLQIQSCNVPKPPNLSRNKKLKYLNLSGCPIEDRLPDLSANIELEELHLAYCQSTIATSVDACVKLIFYNVQCNKIKIACSFANNPRLKRLMFNDNSLSNAPDISECRELMTAMLEGNKIRRLGRLPASLRYLDASTNALQETPDVRDCRLLKVLWLRGNCLISTPDLSNCRRLEFISFTGNPLSLTSKIYLMRHKPKRSGADFPFDQPWPSQDAGRINTAMNDFEFLAALYKRLPAEVSASLLLSNDVENYIQQSFYSLAHILRDSANFQNLEMAIVGKIFKYCLVTPESWMKHNVRLLRRAFGNNERAQRLIDKYVALHEARDKKTYEEHIKQRASNAVVSALVQFKRHKDAEKAALSTLEAQTAQVNDGSMAEDDRYNKITASKCVIA